MQKKKKKKKKNEKKKKKKMKKIWQYVIPQSFSSLCNKRSGFQTEQIIKLVGLYSVRLNMGFDSKAFYKRRVQ